MRGADGDSRRPRWRASVAGVLASLLAGCVAGPDFHRPAPPDVGGYGIGPLPACTASAAVAQGEAQRFVEGAAPAADWWHALGSPRLDALVEQAFAASPTLDAARATLRQAQELQAARAGATRFPQVDAGIAAQDRRLLPESFGQDGPAREFALYDASVGVRYQLDLAGGNRRALEALAARTRHRAHELEAARLALAGNIATTAIAQARLAGQLQVAASLVESRSAQLAIVREQLRMGTAAPDDVLALQGALEESRARLLQLRQDHARHAHRLAVLAGQPPAAEGLPAFTLEELDLPDALPLVLPSELARRRPDIRAAEALLHAATADYGVAVARLYPRLDLGAGLGSQATSAGALFGAGSAAWSLIGQLTQPLFNPGLQAEKRAALAAVDASAAHYRQVVLEALREVADVMDALENDARVLARLAAADRAAQDRLALVRRREALGAASALDVLLARQQALEGHHALVAARAQRLADSVALYQALGGDPGSTRGIASTGARATGPGQD